MALIRIALPTYNLYGLLVRPRDVLGRLRPLSIVEHTFLLDDGKIAHTSGPGDVFRSGWLEEVLKDGGKLRVVDPTSSLDETYLRFANANRLLGVDWWDMNCRQTMAFIVSETRRQQWMM